MSSKTVKLEWDLDAEDAAELMRDPHFIMSLIAEWSNYVSPQEIADRANGSGQSEDWANWLSEIARLMYERLEKGKVET